MLQARRRSMEHKPLDQLRSVADVQPRPLSREERLQRWIDLLERDPARRLNSLGEIEFKPPAERALIREDNSPLTVAYEDPVLRADGLASDRQGHLAIGRGSLDPGRPRREPAGRHLSAELRRDRRINRPCDQEAEHAP